MTDTFDAWWMDESEAEATADPPLPPDGKHSAKVVVAEVKDLSFKASGRNPAGTSLVVKAAVNGYRLAEDIVPVQMRGVIAAICRSLGQDPPAKGETFTAFCQRLVGQVGRIETTQAVSAKGREYVRVSWLDPEPPTPQSQLSAAEDIPF